MHTGYKALAQSLRVGHILEDPELRVATRPEDAFRLDGLWPNGQTSTLYRVETDGEVEAIGEQAKASRWVVSEALKSRPILERLSAAFIDFEDELTQEQLLWRQALTRPKSDPHAVEAALRKAMKARGLGLWDLERAGSETRLHNAPIDDAAMYTWSTHAAIQAWDAWEAEADEDPEFEKARRVAWSMWYQPQTWEEAVVEELVFVDVQPEVWDAWTALSVFFAASQDWIDIPADAYTVGIREAYEHGLGHIKATHRGVLTWALRNR